MSASPPAARRVVPRYQPAEDGTFLLYGGPLRLDIAGDRLEPVGQIATRFDPGADVAAHVTGSFTDLSALVTFGSDPDVTIPQGAPLDPPTSTVLQDPPGGGPRVDRSIPITSLVAGDPSRAQRFLVHVVGSFDARLLAVPTDEGPQGQLSFSLPGWDLVIADTSSPPGRGFPYVVEARPTTPPGVDDLASLRSMLFRLLSFTAGCEVGIAATCGVDEGDRVVWAEFGRPRFRPAKPGTQWCPPDLVPDALPVLAAGYGAVHRDRAYATVIDRAIDHLHFAFAPEVLDVRVPIACSGTELLAWAVLQREGWLTSDMAEARGRSALPAAARARLLL